MIRRYFAMRRALKRIIEWDGCEHSTNGVGSCWRYPKQYTLDCPYFAHRICNACAAWDALGRPKALEAQ